MGRGPHSADATLFAASEHPGLRAACADLSWLLSRGYGEASALKLTGDRYRLRKRQREAVRRAACRDDALVSRSRRRTGLSALAGTAVAIDAFNAIIVVESALAGGVLVRGRDGVFRDLASVHGSYRRVAVTHAAIAALVSALEDAGPRTVTWFLDRPVSNSGRVAQWLRDAAPIGLDWAVELPMDADAAVVAAGGVCVSADSAVLDQAGPWIDLAQTVVRRGVADAWVVDLSAKATEGRAVSEGEPQKNP